MWYRMMAIAFLANGLCAFGVRVLQDLGLAQTHSFLYLAFWYLAGLLISLLAFLWQRKRQSAAPPVEPPGLPAQAPVSRPKTAGTPAQTKPAPFMTPAEALIGGLMGLFSSVGWIFLTKAMAGGVPGYLAFPIAIGGNLSIVAAVGVLIFKEKLTPCGYLGVIAGISGIALLATV